MFMKEKFIKYIGWMLCDESELVRRASIEALIPLYKVGAAAAVGPLWRLVVAHLTDATATRHPADGFVHPVT